MPAIVFPRKGSYEQNERTDILSKSRGNVIFLNEDETSSELLAQKIIEGLKEKKHSPGKIDGAVKTASIISNFYNKFNKSHKK